MEILLEGPGNLKLDLANSKYKGDVLIEPKWIVPDEVYDWAGAFRQAMIDAETEIFDGVLTGSVSDPAISMWWSK